MSTIPKKRSSLPPASSQFAQPIPGNGSTDSGSAARRRVDISQHFVALANRIIALRRSEQAERETPGFGNGTITKPIGKSIGVASCSSKGGASTVAANLAIATSAAVDGEVLLIEASPRRRSRRPGWAELIRGESEMDNVLVDSDVAGLARLHAGTEAGPMLVDPERVKNVVKQLKTRFEFIFIDLPCANELTQCYPIASALDGVLLVVHANRVSTTNAQRATKELEQAGAHLVGVVLNRKRRCAPKFLRRLLPFLSEPE